MPYFNCPSNITSTVIKNTLSIVHHDDDDHDIYYSALVISSLKSVDSVHDLLIIEEERINILGHGGVLDTKSMTLQQKSDEIYYSALELQII